MVEHPLDPSLSGPVAANASRMSFGARISAVIGQIPLLVILAAILCPLLLGCAAGLYRSVEAETSQMQRQQALQLQLLASLAGSAYSKTISRELAYLAERATTLAQQGTLTCREDFTIDDRHIAPDLRLSLLSRDLTPLCADSPTNLNGNDELRAFAQQTLAAEGPGAGPILLPDGAKQALQYLAAPVRFGEGEAAALLILELPLSQLRRDLQNRLGTLTNRPAGLSLTFLPSSERLPGGIDDTKPLRVLPSPLGKGIAVFEGKDRQFARFGVGSTHELTLMAAFPAPQPVRFTPAASLLPIALGAAVSLFLGFLLIVRPTHQLGRYIRALQRLQGDVSLTLPRELDGLRLSCEQMNARAAKECADKDRHYRDLKELHNDLCSFIFRSGHDLKSPLNTLDITLAEMETEIGERGQTMDTLLSDAKKTTTRMQALIRDVLTFSRIAGGHDGETFAPTDLSDTIHDALEDLADKIDEAGARIETGSLPVIKGNQSLLHIFFLNLIGNAIEHRDPARAPAISVRFAQSVDPDWMEIRVADNGIGIENRFLSRIFKPFETLNERSSARSGLGLANCTRIANAHGGRLSVHSEPGEGSTFILHLPKTLLRS